MREQVDRIVEASQLAMTQSSVRKQQHNMLFPDFSEPEQLDNLSSLTPNSNNFCLSWSSAVPQKQDAHSMESEISYRSVPTSLVRHCAMPVVDPGHPSEFASSACACPVALLAGNARHLNSESARMHTGHPARAAECLDEWVYHMRLADTHSACITCESWTTAQLVGKCSMSTAQA